MGRLIRKLSGLIYRRYLAGQVDASIESFLLHRAVVFGGGADRVSIAPSAKVMNALFNVSSGKILVGEQVFFGHNVCLITGTHDYNAHGVDRKDKWPTHGHNIIVEEGVWIGSNATVLGPAVIGAHSVVAAGAVVRMDVPPGTMVAGVPARVVKTIG